jgi:hypothetical protein
VNDAGVAGRYALSGSAVLPSYNPLGGPKGKGHVTFDRTKSQFLDAGQRALNIASNGGLTIVAVARFTGTSLGNWERIIDLTSGGPDGEHASNIILGRFGAESSLCLEIWNGTEKVVGQHCGGIVQDTWMTVAARYRASTREYVVKVNTADYAGIASEGLTDRTSSSTFIGKSQWSSDSYSTGDVAGVFVVDEYLSDAAVSAVIAAIEDGEDADVAFRAHRNAKVYLDMHAYIHTYTWIFKFALVTSTVVSLTASGGRGDRGKGGNMSLEQRA